MQPDPKERPVELKGLLSHSLHDLSLSKGQVKVWLVGDRHTPSKTDRSKPKSSDVGLADLFLLAAPSTQLWIESQPTFENGNSVWHSKGRWKLSAVEDIAWKVKATPRLQGQIEGMDIRMQLWNPSALRLRFRGALAQGLQNIAPATTIATETTKSWPEKLRLQARFRDPKLQAHWIRLTSREQESLLEGCTLHHIRADVEETLACMLKEKNCSLLKKDQGKLNSVLNQRWKKIQASASATRLQQQRTEQSSLTSRSKLQQWKDCQQINRAGYALVLDVYLLCRILTWKHGGNLWIYAGEGHIRSLRDMIQGFFPTDSIVCSSSSTERNGESVLPISLECLRKLHVPLLPMSLPSSHPRR